MRNIRGPLIAEKTWPKLDLVSITDPKSLTLFCSFSQNIGEFASVSQFRM